MAGHAYGWVPSESWVVERLHLPPELCSGLCSSMPAKSSDLYLCGPNQRIYVGRRGGRVCLLCASVCYRVSGRDWEILSWTNHRTPQDQLSSEALARG